MDVEDEAENRKGLVRRAPVPVQTEHDGSRDLRISLGGFYGYEGISVYIHDTSADTS